MFQVRRETELIYQRLRQGNEGDRISVLQMESIAGCNCQASQSPGYHYFRSAADRCFRDTGLFWKWSRPDQAYVCCRDHEKVKHVTCKRKSLTRQARKAKKVIRETDMTKLSKEEQTEHATNAVVISIYSQAGSRKAINRFAAMGTEALAEPSRDELIDMCRARKKVCEDAVDKNNKRTS